HVFTQGETSMKAEWDADKAERMQADNAAILSRVKNNERVAEQQHIDNANITKVHDEELSTVRTALARSERLRIGTALCGGSAGVTQTAGAGSGAATDPGSRVLSTEMDGSVKSLIFEMEEVAATGRSAQAFIRANGMAP
ncbi:hypothetical protein ACFOFO_22720, partial [Undibacterium arcticum]